MKARQREKTLREKLADLVRPVISFVSGFSAHDSQSEKRAVTTASALPVAEIYQQQIITDPKKHIEELAAARTPYANVPFDMID
jgi:hypothetical protein